MVQGEWGVASIELDGGDDFRGGGNYQLYQPVYDSFTGRCGGDGDAEGGGGGDAAATVFTGWGLGGVWDRRLWAVDTEGGKYELGCSYQNTSFHFNMANTERWAALCGVPFVRYAACG